MSRIRVRHFLQQKNILYLPIMHDFYVSPNRSNEFQKGDILGNKYIVSDVWYDAKGNRVVEKAKLSRYKFIRYFQVWFYKTF